MYSVIYSINYITFKDLAMTNTSSGTHKILRRYNMYYRWGIIDCLGLTSEVSSHVCIELFPFINDGYNEMARWLWAQDPDLVKPSGERWCIDPGILTMFVLKFGPGLGHV